MRKQIQHVYPPVGTVLTHQIKSIRSKNKIIMAEIVRTGSKTGYGILYNGKIYKIKSY
jgi:hypothetical protein